MRKYLFLLFLCEILFAFLAKIFKICLMFLSHMILIAIYIYYLIHHQAAILVTLYGFSQWNCHILHKDEWLSLLTLHDEDSRADISLLYNYRTRWKCNRIHAIDNLPDLREFQIFHEIVVQYGSLDQLARS